MATARAKCVNCGANFDVDDTKLTEVCPLCGCSFAVDIAVEEFLAANPGYKTKNQPKTEKQEKPAETNPEDFTITDGVLEKYVGTELDVVVPEGVTAIGQSAFWGCRDLWTVELPETVQEIRNSAFYGCSSLMKINFPESLTEIGNNAFEDCVALTDLPLPNSLRQLGERAFRGCLAVKTLTIPNTISKISEDAFRGCAALEEISIPGSVTEIGEDAFRGCAAVKSVVIPSSVSTIGMGAFNGCTELSRVVIPDSVVNVSAGIFAECGKLEEIYASESWKRAHWQVAKCLEKYDPSRKKGACYIATAVYGSYDCPQVWTLRRYRDGVLAGSLAGRAFIRTYYALSPALLRLFGEQNWFRTLWRRRLDRMVERLRAEGLEDTPYEDRNW